MTAASIDALRDHARRLLDGPAIEAPGDAAAPPSGPEATVAAQTRPRARGAVPLDRVLIGVALTVWSLTVAYIVSGSGDATTRRAVTDLAEPGLDLIAVLAILRGARRVEIGRVRLAWLVVGLATLVYAAGDALYAWFDLGTGATFPSLADAAYVSYYPLIGAALMLFPTAVSGRREALRLAIDSSIVVIGAGILVWHTLFGPALASLAPDPLTAGLALGYPIGDLVLVFGVVAMALRRPTGADPRALAALVAGLVLMFVADVGYGQLSLEGSFDVQRWPDVGYLSSTLLIAAAGYLQARPAPAPAEGQGRGLNGWLLVLPYGGVAAGYGVLIALAQGTVSGELGQVLYGAVVLTVLVLVRQELVLRENGDLLADRARRDSEARFRSLAAHASDAIMLVDGSGIVAYATPAVERILGLDAAALVGRPLASLSHAADRDQLRALIADVVGGRPVPHPVEWRLWDPSGTWRQVETIAANLLDDPSVGHIVLTTRDIRERKALEQQLTQVSLHDQLTSLPNRALFNDRLGQALAGAGRGGRRTTVLYLGLDGFKRVNESLGHAAGDQILMELAGRLRASIGTADTCARLAGDKFGVQLDGHPSIERALVVANGILGAFREPVSLGGNPIHLTASLGIASAGPSDGDASSLLGNAELARSVARDAGGDRVVVFEPAMQEAVRGRFELEADLRQALERNELVLEYQPIVDLVRGELVGAEALVRWEHPTRGRLGPSAFIPLAEETGLIDEIGAWVLRTACIEVARWSRLARGQVPRVSINLSAHQVADPQLPWTVQTAIAQAGAAPNWITLEITESLLMQNSPAVRDQLHAIRVLGVAIAIDDFGTGYSSLSYLQEFPITHLKIDLSFVARLDDPAQGPGIVRAIVEIGRALGLETVAEGIETLTELERLRRLGCTLGQGFLLARPLSADAMAALVARPSGSLLPAGTEATPGPSGGGLAQALHASLRRQADARGIPALVEVAHTTASSGVRTREADTTRRFLGRSRSERL